VKCSDSYRKVAIRIHWLAMPVYSAGKSLNYCELPDHANMVLHLPRLHHSTIVLHTKHKTAFMLYGIRIRSNVADFVDCQKKRSYIKGIE